MHLVCNVEQNMDADLLEKGSLQKKKMKKKFPTFSPPPTPSSVEKLAPLPILSNDKILCIFE